MPPLRVALIDRDRLFRDALAAVLQEQGVEFVAALASLKEVAAAGLQEHDGVLLVEPVGLGPTGEVVEALRGRAPRARLVVLTAALDPVQVVEAMRAGADAYLVKDISPVALLQSLRLALAGEKVFPSGLAAVLARALGPSGSDAGETLSRREADILRGVARGASNRRIAEQLGITEATVKVHLKGLLRKLGVANRTQAAIWAHQHPDVLDGPAPRRAG